MAKTYGEIVNQMEVDIKAIRESVHGVETRDHIASGMENVLEIYKQIYSFASSSSANDEASQTSSEGGDIDENA